MLALPALLIFKGYITFSDFQKSHSMKLQHAPSYKYIFDKIKFFKIKTISRRSDNVSSFNISKVHVVLRVHHSATNNCMFIKYFELVTVFNSSDNFFLVIPIQ